MLAPVNEAAHEATSAELELFDRPDAIVIVLMRHVLSEKPFRQLLDVPDALVKIATVLNADLIGAMSGDVSKDIFVTTSTFDDSAIRKAKDAHDHKIVLIDGDRLADLMIKYDVGVQVRTKLEMKEIDDGFFEAN
ncbi:hypothetical protein COX00_03835 [Candidatus Uhrbacteria bacterium CG22_combo_CG10-13_8_21_14_all_47_17]|uniref:Restriction endonuclease type IV Mrr domain-containing protein n=1 Tax=Candidatus Uhrbacteria bacterium CG22_combo_CG10-13_8_21_14_all_47_17 TaxID=1975041 RepID=A0A2H0BRP7_9BACT|nr:MAG: hypothetical protein COX00_03835 [Candidatus Uhrbacteria bacterium CG22_combo_CG10-13_8_21_14_all_47_17]